MNQLKHEFVNPVRLEQLIKKGRPKAAHSNDLFNQFLFEDSK